MVLRADSARLQRRGWMISEARPASTGPLLEADEDIPPTIEGMTETIGALSIDLQSQSSDRKRRRRHMSSGITLYNLFLVLVLALLVETGASVQVPFHNCFDSDLKNQLQFVPIYFDAFFDTANSTHLLNTTIYGNVTGSTSSEPLPPPTDPSWGNSSIELGKIVNVSDPTGSKKITALTSRFNVLTYTPYEQSAAFCDSVINHDCPLIPIFKPNETNPLSLNAFTVAHDFNSSYAFTTFATTYTIVGGGTTALKIGCVSANITPDFGKKLSALLAYVPLAILIVSGAATAFAGVLSPWGTVDTFKWTSNYGRDEDLLRLVTPGFGDCLQYLQFVVLTGSLSLKYPGFYQPAVSQASWSTLMFNVSFVSHGNGTSSVEDGIYAVREGYGLDRMSQYVGMSQVDDVWAGMMVWLLVILAAVIVFIQAGFLVRWLYRQISDIPEEDLRAKNMPFSVGNVIRIVFNYFLLPIVALSMFQLVMASRSPAYVVALAAVVFVVLLGFSAWLLRVVVTTRPRSHLFDDLPTVLLYGPLYNTYSDNAAAFAMVPVMLNFIRGIAIGAVQASGVAQVVLLAICEVVFILTLHAFRPFHSPTSMNAYHTFFAIIRLLTTLLSIAFVPSLGVTEPPKGWIGYVILLMHAIALVFGFLLNSIQTFAEVGARLAGAGGEAGGATRGGLVKVFGMRQLSRRLPRMQNPRNSALTGAGTLSPDDVRKSGQLSGRARSLSGSSAKLLGRAGASDSRLSGGLDSMSGGNAAHRHRDSGSGPFTPSTPGAASTFSTAAAAANNGGILGISNVETATPYYRPPRPRRLTVDASPAARSRGSWNSADWANKRWSHASGDPAEALEVGDLPSASGRETPVPSHLISQQHQSESNVNEPTSNTDYAVREVDFYYGVRGPALSTLPTRRLGTGPADPTGPVASAAGWFKGLFGGKTKDKGKGFEVVRSSRMPPAMMAAKASGLNSPDDSETGPAKGTARGLALDTRAAPLHPKDADDVSPLEESDASNLAGHEEADLSDDESATYQRHSQISPLPPSLPGIDAGENIELPSRIGSKASSKRSTQSIRVPGLPYVKRKSSKRKSGTMSSVDTSDTSHESRRLSTIMSPPRTPATIRNSGTASPSRMPFASQSSSATGARDSVGGESIGSPAMSRPLDGASDQSHRRDSSSALGTNTPSMHEGPPTSMGYVQAYRTSDNIRRMNSAERAHVDSHGSAAEVVTDAKRAIASTRREPIE